MPVLPQHSASAGSSLMGARRPSSARPWLSTKGCMRALMLFLFLSAVGLVSVTLSISGKKSKTAAAMAGKKILPMGDETAAATLAGVETEVVDEGPETSAAPEDGQQRRMSAYPKTDANQGDATEERLSLEEDNQDVRSGLADPQKVEDDGVLRAEAEDEEQTQEQEPETAPPPLPPSPSSKGSFFSSLFSSRKKSEEDTPRKESPNSSGSNERQGNAALFAFEQEASRPKKDAGMCSLSMEDANSPLAPQLLFVMATGSTEQQALLPPLPSVCKRPKAAAAGKASSSPQGQAGSEAREAVLPAAEDIRVLLAEPHPRWAKDLASERKQPQQQRWGNGGFGASFAAFSSSGSGSQDNQEDEDEDEGEAGEEQEGSEGDASVEGDDNAGANGAASVTRALGKLLQEAQRSSEQENRDTLKRKAKEERYKEAAKSKQRLPTSAASTRSGGGDAADEEEHRLLQEAASAAAEAQRRKEEEESAEDSGAADELEGSDRLPDSQAPEEGERESGDDSDATEEDESEPDDSWVSPPLSNPELPLLPHFSAFADGFFFNGSSLASLNPQTNDSSPLPLSLLLHAYDEDAPAAQQALAVVQEVIYSQVLRSSLIAHALGLKVNPALHSAASPPPAPPPAPAPAAPPSTAGSSSPASPSSTTGFANNANNNKGRSGGGMSSSSTASSTGATAPSGNTNKNSNNGKPPQSPSSSNSNKEPADTSASPVALAAFSPSSLSLRLKVEAEHQRRAVALFDGCSPSDLLPALKALAANASYALEASGTGVRAPLKAVSGVDLLELSASVNRSIVELADRCGPFLLPSVLKARNADASNQDEDGEEGAHVEPEAEAESSAAAGDNLGLALAVDASSPLPSSSLALPLFVHSGELSIGRGPILVLGSGDGHLALRLAQVLPENTVVSSHWASGGGATGELAFRSLIAPHQSPSNLRSIANALGCKAEALDGFAWGSRVDLGESSDSLSSLKHDFALMSASETTSKLKRLLGVPNLWVTELPSRMPSVSAAGNGASVSSSIEQLIAYLHGRAASSSPSLQFGRKDEASASEGDFSLGLLVLTPSALARLYAESFDGLFNAAQGKGKAVSAASRKAAFEGLLGKVLALSRYVLLPSSLPDEASLARDPFFARLPMDELLSTGSTASVRADAEDCGFAEGDQPVEATEGTDPRSRIATKLEQRRVKLLRRRIKRVASFFRNTWGKSTADGAGGVDRLIEGAVRAVGLTATARPLGSLALPGSSPSSSSSSSSSGMMVLALQRADEAEAEEEAYAAAASAAPFAPSHSPSSHNGGARGGLFNSGRAGAADRRGPSPSSAEDQYPATLSSLLAQPELARVLFPLTKAYSGLAALHISSPAIASGRKKGPSPLASLEQSAAEAATILGLGSTTPAQRSALSAALQGLAALDNADSSSNAASLPFSLASSIGLPVDLLMSIGLRSEESAELARLTMRALASSPGASTQDESPALLFATGGQVTVATARKLPSAEDASSDSDRNWAQLAELALDIIKQHGPAKGLRLASTEPGGDQAGLDDLVSSAASAEGNAGEAAADINGKTADGNGNGDGDEDDEDLGGLLGEEVVGVNEEKEGPVGGLKKQKLSGHAAVKNPSAKASAASSPSAPPASPPVSGGRRGKSEFLRLADALARENRAAKKPASEKPNINAGKQGASAKTEPKKAEKKDTAVASALETVAASKEDTKPSIVEGKVSPPSSSPEVVELVPEPDNSVAEVFVGDSEDQPQQEQPAIVAASGDEVVGGDGGGDNDVESEPAMAEDEGEVAQEGAAPDEVQEGAPVGPRALLEVSSQQRRASLRAKAARTSMSSSSNDSPLTSAFRRPTAWKEMRPVLAPVPASLKASESSGKFPAGDRNNVATLHSFRGLSQLSPRSRRLRKRRLQLLHGALSDSEGASFTRLWSFLQAGSPEAAHADGASTDRAVELLLHGSSASSSSSAASHSSEPSSVLVAGTGASILLSSKLARSLHKASSSHGAGTSSSAVVTLFPQGSDAPGSLGASAASLRFASSLFGGPVAASLSPQDALSPFFADLNAKSDSDGDGDDDDEENKAAVKAAEAYDNIAAARQKLVNAHVASFPYFFAGSFVKADVKAVPAALSLSALVKASAISSSSERRRSGLLSSALEVQEELVSHLLSQSKAQRPAGSEVAQGGPSVLSLIGGADLSAPLAKALLIPHLSHAAQSPSAPFTHLFVTGLDGVVDSHFFSAAIEEAESQLVKGASPSAAAEAAAKAVVERWTDKLSSLVALSSRQAVLELPSRFAQSAIKAVEIVLKGKHSCKRNSLPPSQFGNDLPCALVVGTEMLAASGQKADKDALLRLQAAVSNAVSSRQRPHLARSEGDDNVSSQQLLHFLSLAVPAMWVKAAGGPSGRTPYAANTGGAKKASMLPLEHHRLTDRDHRVLLSSLDLLHAALTIAPVTIVAEEKLAEKSAPTNGAKNAAPRLTVLPRALWWQAPQAVDIAVGGAAGRLYTKDASARLKASAQSKDGGVKAQDDQAGEEGDAEAESLFAFGNRPDAVSQDRSSHASSKSPATLPPTMTSKGRTLPPQPMLVVPWEPCGLRPAIFEGVLALSSSAISSRRVAPDVSNSFPALFARSLAAILEDKGAAAGGRGGADLLALPLSVVVKTAARKTSETAVALPSQRDNDILVGLLASALSRLEPITDTASLRMQIDGTGTSLVILEKALKGSAQATRSQGSGLPLHSLLTLQPRQALRAELARAFLSLPIQAIARDALTAGLSLPSLSLSPTQLHLTPTSDGAARLVFLSASGSSFSSRLAVSCSSVAMVGVSDTAEVPVSSDKDSTDLQLLEVWSALSSQLLALDTASGGASEEEEEQGDTSALRTGKFSFVDIGSGVGSISLLTAKTFPNATVLSIESNKDFTDAHLAAAIRAGISNNLIGSSQSTVGDSALGVATQELLKRINESPEFFRFVTFGLTPSVDSAATSSDKSKAGNLISGSAEEVLMKLLASQLQRMNGVSALPDAAETPVLTAVLSAVSSARGIYGVLPGLAVSSFTRAPPAALLSLLFTVFHDLYPSQGGSWLLAAGGSGAVVVNAAKPSGLVSEAKAEFCPPELWPIQRSYSPSLHRSCLAVEAGLHLGRDGVLATPLSSLLRSKESLAAAMSAPLGLEHHPRRPFVRSDSVLISSLLRTPAHSQRNDKGSSVEASVAAIPALVSLPSQGTAASASIDAIKAPPRRPLSRQRSSSLLPSGLSSGLIRMDITQLTRHVNHHYQSSIDGHTRKYTLHVQRNLTAAAVLSRHVLAQRGLDVETMHSSIEDNLKGVSGAKTSIDDVYRHLPPGNHPNHGLTTAGDALLIVKAALANAVDEARLKREKEEKERLEELKREKLEAAKNKNKRKGSGAADTNESKAKKKAKRKKGKSAPSGGGGSGSAVEIQFPVVDEQIKKGLQLLGSSHSASSSTSRSSATDSLPGVVSIILTRDMDGAFIPYTSVHGITLISLLRLGLLPPLKARAYHQFVSLPLYLDMAPWNIVARGSALDYIDFDTKDRTFDKQVEQAYQVMEVLFNYKRTLEDFKRCQGKGSNPYGFPFVSECVGKGDSGTRIDGGKPLPSCSDSRLPVPCSDGACHSSYISCLRSISAQERLKEGRSSIAWAVEQKVKAAAKARAAADAAAAAENNEDDARAGDEAEAAPQDGPLLAEDSVKTLANEANKLTKDFLGGLGSLQSGDRAAREVPADDEEDEEEEDESPLSPPAAAPSKPQQRGKAALKPLQKLKRQAPVRNRRAKKPKGVPLPIARDEEEDGE